MNRKFRLTSSTDFRRVRRTGRSYAHPLAVLIVSSNGGEDSRYGVTAGKAIGGAVRRNRAKRRLRGALQELHPAIAGGWDLVLIARAGLLKASWQDLVEAIRNLLHRANLHRGAA